MRKVMAKLTAIQLCAVPDVDENLASIDRQLSQLALEQNHLVVLPECCLYFGGQEIDQLTLAKHSEFTLSKLVSTHEYSQQLIIKLSALARQYGIYLLAGTIPLLCKNTDKYSNTSCLFSPSGQLLEKYDKIHLFDVSVADNEKSYLESRYTQAGNVVTTAHTPFATIGFSICYDLRFPELYRALRCAHVDIITVPSAFTKVTGTAHWQTLIQARAIENQCYIIAAGQTGKHANGRETWGHSMIVSPWGEILACLPEGEGSITVEYDPKALTKIRQAMPVLEHNQFTVELKHP
jgi:predicted amidohydrolase